MKRVGQRRSRERAGGFAAQAPRAEAAKNAGTGILTGPNPPDRRSDSQQITKTLSRMSESADCILNFAGFLEEAKPEEIRLLADILSEWRNWSGSVRRGNFLRGVAEAVLAGDTGRDLSRWPAARKKLR